MNEVAKILISVSGFTLITDRSINTLQTQLIIQRLF